MKTNQLLLLAGLGLAGVGLYMYMQRQNPYAGPGATYIPAGGQQFGYVNTTGAPVWVTATGTILNGLGQVLTSIPWDQFVNSGGNQDGAAAAGAAVFNI